MGRITDFFKRFWKGTDNTGLTRAQRRRIDTLGRRMATTVATFKLDDDTIITGVEDAYTALIGSGEYSVEKALRYAMRHSVWVGRSAQILADAAGSLPPRAERPLDLAAQEFEPLEYAHPFAKLLRTPSPGKPYPLWCRELIHQLLFRGKADYVVVRSPLEGSSETRKGLGLPVELQLLEKRRTEEVLDANGNIIGYLDTTTGQVWLKEEVFTIIYSDAWDTRKPIAPYEWTRGEAEQDRKAGMWNEEAFDNRFGADALIRLLPDGESEQWDSEEAWKAALRRFKAAYLGAKNARSPMITSEKVEVETLGNNANHVDIDFTEGRKLLREGETAGIGVPPMMAGIMDQAALNNYRVAKQVLYELTIIPFWRFLEAHINTQVAPEFGEGYRAFWDDKKVPELFPRSAERWKAASEHGAKHGVPWSELNTIFDLGLEPWLGWDVAGAFDASGLFDILERVCISSLDPIAAELVIVTSYPSVAREVAAEMVAAQYISALPSTPVLAEAA